MRQTLQLRLGQQLTMTPQLQQAIRPVAALQPRSAGRGADHSRFQPDAGTGRRSAGHAGAARDTGLIGRRRGTRAETEIDAAARDTMPDELPVDSSWEDVYGAEDGATPYSRGEDEDWDPYERYAGTGESLRDYLYWQMRLTPFNERDMAIATALIDAIGRGRLSDAVAGGYLPGSARRFIVTRPRSKGCCARCSISTRRVSGPARRPNACCCNWKPCRPIHRRLAGARRLVEAHLDLLAARDFSSLMRRLRVTREELPGGHHCPDSVPWIRIQGRACPAVRPTMWCPMCGSIASATPGGSELNPESTPKLRINARYAALARKAPQAGDSAYLKNHLQEARWFLKSLQNRNETLLKVAACIVGVSGTIERGDEYMKPLILRDIARGPRHA